MRTSIVGLTRLHDRARTAASAHAVAALTHADPLALDSCVLWWDAVRRAVLSGHLDLAAGLDLVDSERRDQWAAWVAGGLLGARYGASEVPAEWSSSVHGWPVMRADDVVTLALETTQAGV
jgi:ADP-ribosyl-[dinitrogen reductase] hydrolase